jgi:hypothetical protein
MLRLSYIDQPTGEFLEIAHVPVHRHGGQPIRLMVGYDGSTFLLLGKVGDLKQWCLRDRCYSCFATSLIGPLVRVWTLQPLSN